MYLENEGLHMEHMWWHSHPNRPKLQTRRPAVSYIPHANSKLSLNGWNLHSEKILCYPLHTCSNDIHMKYVIFCPQHLKSWKFTLHLSAMKAFWQDAEDMDRGCGLRECKCQHNNMPMPLMYRSLQIFVIDNNNQHNCWFDFSQKHQSIKEHYGYQYSSRHRIYNTPAKQIIFPVCTLVLFEQI